MEDDKQKHLLQASPSRRRTRPVEGGEGANHGGVVPFLRDALQRAGEQLRRVLCPIAIQILEHARRPPAVARPQAPAVPAEPGVHEEAAAMMRKRSGKEEEEDQQEKMKLLSAQNSELQERIAAAEARLAAEEAARHELLLRAVALQDALESAMREEEEEMEVMRKGMDEASEELRVKLADVERIRLEGLSQVKRTISDHENRLALSRLTQEAHSSFFIISRLAKAAS